MTRNEIRRLFTGRAPAIVAQATAHPALVDLATPPPGPRAHRHYREQAAAIT